MMYAELYILVIIIKLQSMMWVWDGHEKKTEFKIPYYVMALGPKPLAPTWCYKSYIIMKN